MTEHKHLDHSWQQRTLYQQNLQTPIFSIRLHIVLSKAKRLKRNQNTSRGDSTNLLYLFLKFHLKRGEGKRGEVWIISLYNSNQALRDGALLTAQTAAQLYPSQNTDPSQLRALWLNKSSSVSLFVNNIKEKKQNKKITPVLCVQPKQRLY